MRIPPPAEPTITSNKKQGLFCINAAKLFDIHRFVSGIYLIFPISPQRLTRHNEFQVEKMIFQDLTVQPRIIITLKPPRNDDLSWQCPVNITRSQLSLFQTN